jgi:hypothetical protein
MLVGVRSLRQKGRDVVNVVGVDDDWPPTTSRDTALPLMQPMIADTARADKEERPGSDESRVESGLGSSRSSDNNNISSSTSQADSGAADLMRRAMTASYETKQQMKSPQRLAHNKPSVALKPPPTQRAWATPAHPGAGHNVVANMQEMVQQHSHDGTSLLVGLLRSSDTSPANGMQQQQQQTANGASAKKYIKMDFDQRVANRKYTFPNVYAQSIVAAMDLPPTAAAAGVDAGGAKRKRKPNDNSKAAKKKEAAKAMEAELRMAAQGSMPETSYSSELLDMWKKRIAYFRHTTIRNTSVLSTATATSKCRTRAANGCHAPTTTTRLSSATAANAADHAAANTTAKTASICCGDSELATTAR